MAPLFVFVLFLTSHCCPIIVQVARHWLAGLDKQPTWLLQNPQLVQYLKAKTAEVSEYALPPLVAYGLAALWVSMQ